MKHLLKHFKDLSIHPKNAAELKGLILQLAVQGKLTANWRLENPDVESASVLLNEIKAERELLVKDKKAKKETVLNSITAKEFIKDIPTTWESVRLGEVIEIVRGITFPSSEKSKVDSLGKVPCLRTANVQDKIEWDDLLYIDRKFVKREDQILQNGDVIMSMANSYELVGKVALIDKNLDRECTLGGFISALRTFKFDHYYLMILLRSPKTRSELISSSSQTTNIANVSIGKLRPLIIPFPPLEEQKAIVSTVNTLFAEVEQLEALTKERIQLKEAFVQSALKRLAEAPASEAQTRYSASQNAINGEWAFLQQHFPTFFTEVPNIKKLRESILQLAVQGKLTSHWRASVQTRYSASPHSTSPLSASPEKTESADYNAAILLDKIKAEKAQLIKDKKIKKEKPLPEITSNEIPYELPEGWVWCRLGDILNLFLGGFAYKSSKFISSSSNQVLRLGNVKNNLIRFESNPVFVDDDYAKESIGYRLKQGDILITMTGTRAKKDYCFTALLNETHFESRNLFLNQRVGCLRFSNNTSLGYVDLALKEPHLLTPVFDKATGTANQANIGKGAIIENLFPLPPLEEQQAIVEKVNTLMALCDQLEQAIQNSKATQEDWMKSSLREVFTESSANKKTKNYQIDGGLSMVAEP